MYPSSFSHLKTDYSLPTGEAVATVGRRKGLRRGFRAKRPAVALGLRSARYRPAGPGYRPCD
jgi:hypothetical protein